MSFWDIFNLSDSFLIESASVWCSILISLPETPFAALNAIWISYSLFRKGSISLRSDLSSHGRDTVHDCLIAHQPGMQGWYHRAFSLPFSFGSQLLLQQHQWSHQWCWLPPLRHMPNLAATSPSFTVCLTQGEMTPRSLPSPSYMPVSTSPLHL